MRTPKNGSQLPPAVSKSSIKKKTVLAATLLFVAGLWFGGAGVSAGAARGTAALERVFASLSLNQSAGQSGKSAQPKVQNDEGVKKDKSESVSDPKIADTVVANFVNSANATSSSGGPVVLDGMDPVLHSAFKTDASGSGTHQYIGKIMKIVYDYSTVTPTNNKIVVLGTVSGGCVGGNLTNLMTNVYLDKFTGTKPAFTVYDTKAGYETFFSTEIASSNPPKMIWIPDAYTSCRATDMEAVLTANAEKIADFVNSGGGIFASWHAFGWLKSLIPTAQFLNGGSGTGPNVTADGISEFGLSNSDVAAPWHGQFKDYGVLKTLATLSVGGTTQVAIVGGASIVLPTSFQLAATPSDPIAGDTVTITASAKKSDGTPEVGLSISMAITAGPDTGTTLTTATTDSSGVATFTHTTNSVGTNTYTASATISGKVKTAVATITWKEKGVRVISITRVGAATTSDSAVSWNIVFSNSISGLNPANFKLVDKMGMDLMSGEMGKVTGITGSGTNWTVTVDPGNVSDVLNLSMVNGTGVSNPDGLKVVELPFTNMMGGFTIAPRILSVTRSGSDPVVYSGSGTPVTFSIKFNEEVTGLTSSNFALSGTSASQSSITAVTGSGTDWVVAVSVGGTGTVAVSFANSTGAADLQSNPVGGLPYALGSASVAPAVVSINRAGATPAGGDTVTYTVTFSESVTGLAANSFQLVTTGGGTPGASLGAITGSGTTWTVTVNLGFTAGSVGLNFAAPGSAKDSDGLGAIASSLPFVGQVYQIAPRIISLKRAGASMTAMNYAEWLVTFNEPVTGLTTSNLVIPPGVFTPKTAGQAPSFGPLTVSGSVWKVRLNIPKGQGTVGLNMVNITGIVDAAGLGVLQTMPLVGETVAVISVELATTNTRITSRRRTGTNPGIRDLATVQQGERVGNGDLFMRTFTVENSGGAAINGITYLVSPAVRVLPWDFSCSLPGDCTISSPRSDRQVLTTPNGPPAAGVGAPTQPQEVKWTGTLAASDGIPGSGPDTITIEVYVQVTNEALPGEILAATAVLLDPAMLPVTLLDVDPTPTNVSYLPMGPGGLTAGMAALSGQRPASMLIYPLYTSTVNVARQDSRFTLTNASPDLTSYVHLFFVDGSDCSVADQFVTLTPSQTVSFLASDLDPTVTGYLVALAVDDFGFPQHFNHLIGSVYVKFESGHAANLPAVGVAALAGGARPVMMSESDTTMDLYLDGISYSEIPRTLAVNNIPSRADGNQTMLVVNRIGGDLTSGGSALSALYGLVYDDRENAKSYTVAGGSCQLRLMVNGTTVRTSPRFESLVPSGRTGWMRISSVNDEGILGAMINYNAGGFNQGHVLHALTTTRSVVIRVPMIPPVI